MTPLRCQELIDMISRAGTVEEIHSLCCALCKESGFDYFIYGTRIPTSFVKPHIFIICSYPQDWRDRYVTKGYIRVDPTVVHCANNFLPLTWEMIEPLEKENREIRTFMTESRDFGLKDGVTFPIHTPQGEGAMLSMALGKEKERSHSLILHAIPYIQLISLHIHEAVRRVLNLERTSLPRLSGREKECLLWCAEGKTSWETSKIIGVSERTVVFHLQNASEKLKVANRLQAVARAVSVGLIAPQL